MKGKTNRGINFTLNIFDETLQEKVKIDKKIVHFQSPFWFEIISYCLALYFIEWITWLIFIFVHWISCQLVLGMKSSERPELIFTKGTDRNFRICNKLAPNRNGILEYVINWYRTGTEFQLMENNRYRTGILSYGI